MTKRMIKGTSDELLWANEVMEVYKNLGSLPGSRNWSSSSASHLYDWVVGEDRKHEEKFLTTIISKATDILTKNSQEDIADAVKEIDLKTITELQLSLATALQASKEGPYVETEPEPEPESEFEALVVKSINDKVATYCSENDDTDLEPELATPDIPECREPQAKWTLEDIIGL